MPVLSCIVHYWKCENLSASLRFLKSQRIGKNVQDAMLSVIYKNQLQPKFKLSFLFFLPCISTLLLTLTDTSNSKAYSSYPLFLHFSSLTSTITCYLTDRMYVIFIFNFLFCALRPLDIKITTYRCRQTVFYHRSRITIFDFTLDAPKIFLMLLFW